jgi:hypothetical protein
LFRKDNHTRHTCEMLDKILYLFQILKQILLHNSSHVAIKLSREFLQIFVT